MASVSDLGDILYFDPIDEKEPEVWFTEEGYPIPKEENTILFCDPRDYAAGTAYGGFNAGTSTVIYVYPEDFVSQKTLILYRLRIRHELVHYIGGMADDLRDFLNELPGIFGKLVRWYYDRVNGNGNNWIIMLLQGIYYDMIFDQYRINHGLPVPEPKKGLLERLGNTR